jgi:hypothetical protein
MTKFILAAATAAVVASPAFAGNVSPGVIFGSGNANGSFTINNVQSNANVEIGLRAKLRFNDSNKAENTFNWDGDRTYTFSNGAASPGFSFDANSPTTPVWNFEWSINSDRSSTTTFTPNPLASLTYVLSIDGDASAGTNFAETFDPINVGSMAFADHSLGNNTNASTDATDFKVTSATNNPAFTYNTLIGSAANSSAYNVAQNSWNYQFFNEATDARPLSQLASFDPNELGVYTITLEAFDGATRVAASSIDVSVVPEPTAVLGGLGLLSLVGLRRRQTAE